MKAMNGTQVVEELETLVARLQSLDCRDAAWPEIARLVELAIRTVQTKADERTELARVTNVSRHLEAFSANFADEIAFHEIEWPEEWCGSSGAVYVQSREEADQVVRLLDSMGSLLQDYQTLHEKLTTASTKKESREVREKLDRVELDLESTYQQLAAILATARLGVATEAHLALETEAALEVAPEMMPESEKTPEPEAVPEAEAMVEPDHMPEVYPEPTVVVEDVTALEPQPEVEAPVEAVAQPQAEALTEAESAPEQKPESKPGHEPEAESEPQSQSQPQLEAVPDSKPHAVLGAQEVSEDDPGWWLWERLTAGDLATAYWLSHGDGDVPPWLLRACLLARHVRVSGDEPSSLLSAIIYNHADPIGAAEERGLTKTQALLITALASVGPALKAPETGAMGWLQAASPLAKSVPFLEPILEFVSCGIALGPETIAEGRSEAETRAELKRLRESAESWLTQQRSGRLGYAPATDVMRELAGGGHPLGQAVTAVIRDDRKDYGLVRMVLDEYLASDTSMRNLIDTVHAERKGPSAPRIVGKILETMLTRLGEIREILGAWTQLVREPDSAQAGWRKTQITTFRQAFRAAWSGCASEPPAPLLTDPRTAALAELLWTEARSLADELILPAAGLATTQDPPATWVASIRKPLLLLVPSPITAQGGVPEQLSNEQVRDLVSALRTGRTLREVMQLHVQARDFLAARFLLEEPDLAQDPALRSQVEQAQVQADAQLRERVERLRRDLEVNTALHVVTDSERSDFEARLLSLEAMAEEDCRYEQFFADCDQIERELGHLSEMRIASLRERLPELDEQIAQADGQTREKAEEYRNAAVKNLERGDLALADEYFSLAERTLQYGYEEEADVHLQVLEADRFDRFKNSIEALNKLLDDDDKRRRRTVRDAVAAAKGIPGVLDQRQVPGARKAEIAKALDGFHHLKTRAHKLEKDYVKAVGDIVTYLGFQPPSDITKQSSGESYWHYQVRTTDAGASPLPHFGSERNGLYDLLVVWERPNAERLGQIVQETHTATRCPIILFLGRLTFKQREEWGAYCKKHELTVLLVDEGLLYWLAGVRENRLRHAVAFSLPWGYANPYKPVAGGLVAPEMFVGRKSIIRELADLKGSVIIYGGRQLGKSAVLRAIERDYHHPKRKWFVFYNDIRHLGSTQDVTAVWRQLRDWAVDQKLIDPKVLDRPDNITQELVRYFDKNPEAQVRVLLDEADNFLAADARRDFQELQNLKRLMDLTDRRFKVVLSGLHSVQRYCSVPNHPFAHLNPVGIGPLDPQDARSLIVEPMQMLGFIFSEESEQAIYRIFAITNYQPALIQHICAELVRSRRLFRPPYKLTVRMVEDLTRQPSVRQFISERFTWTVGLDPRYEGLVYSMILEQFGERDGFRRQFTAREALELARSWWPKGFDDVMPDEAAALLRELVGLGVLVQLDTGHFRLRNANVVRMLGSQAEIWERMQQLAEQEPKQEFDPRKVRAKLPDDDRAAWSPFTLEQEGDLTKTHAGIRLVFCSKAQGRDRLQSALNALVQGPGSNQFEGAVLKPPADCLSLNNFRAFLEHSLGRAQSGRYILYMTATHLLNCSEPPSEILQQIGSLLNRRRSRHRLLQCVVSFDAAETVRWFTDPALGEAEPVGVDVTVCYPWPREMIRHSLTHYGMLVNEAVVDEVLGATGGWPVLFEEMMNRLPAGNLENTDPRRVCHTLRDDLKPGGHLGARFLAEVGLYDVPLGEAICRMVVELGPGDFGEITEDLVPGAGSQGALTRQVVALQHLGILRREQEHVVCDPVVRAALGL